MQIERILLAVDGSAHSDKALEQALYLAKLAGGSILLLHCRRRAPSFLGEPYKDADASFAARAEQVIEKYEARLQRSGIPYEADIREGTIARTISQTADEENCNLIVMGSRGLSDIKGLMIGSVTHKVLHLATVPVLVVH